jgi:serine/threonine-protein kinase RsbW
MSIQIVLMLPPTAASVSLARHTLVEALELADVTAACMHESEVALSEACTNAFHYAARDQNFEVVIGIGDQELILHILDAGPGPATNGHHWVDWPDDTAVNGRGMALMDAFMDFADFDFHGRGGSVRLKKRLLRNAEVA